MAYLVNSARVYSLLVGGINLTSSMVSWTCSDSSANKSGLISTTGTLTLGQEPGGYNVEDYDRDNFRRGTPVIMTMQFPGGAIARHPRGLLYVLSASYSTESSQLVVQLGCRLALANLTEDVSALLPLSPVYLDPTQRSYQNISAAFVSVGKYLYQDNQGNLVVGVFFQDTTAGTQSGAWVSVLGYTATSVQPLTGTTVIPDEIELGYRFPSGLIASDNQGQVVVDQTDSYYYITYPAISYERVNDGTLTDITDTATEEPSTGSVSSCGNTPEQPADNGTPSCNEGYETVQTPYILPAHRIETNRSEYSGPAGQLSRVLSQTYGPALEANDQYYSDKFAYCRNTWATACQPNGGCPYEGQDNILLAYSEQRNYYGNANELVKTVIDTYAPTLSAAQPFNWRSGVVNGVPQNFQTLSTTDLYRYSSVITEYEYGKNSTTQTATTYTSVTSRQSGISGVIDALSGIKTLTRRVSTTISANPLVPDLVNTATTDTTDRTITLRLFTGRYQLPPAEAGPYILKEQVPAPLLFNTKQEILQAVGAYANHLQRFVKGDAFGLQIGEGLRDDIVRNWRPGMPFRYVDRAKGRVLAMRMDATVWGVDQTGSALVTNGIWIGNSNGSVRLPRNIVGDSRPSLSPATVTWLEETYNSLPVRAWLSIPTSLKGDTDVIMLLHGTITTAGVNPQDAADKFVEIATDSGGLDFNDKIVLSIAYPQDDIPGWTQTDANAMFPGINLSTLLFGDNIAYVEAAVEWAKAELANKLVSLGEDVVPDRFFLYGHSQGAYLAHRVTRLVETDKVSVNAPGPIDLLTRCQYSEANGDENGTCLKIKNALGSTVANPSAYTSLSLTAFLDGTLSPILYTQADDDLDALTYGINQPALMRDPVQTTMEACTDCVAPIEFNYYTTGGHDSFVYNKEQQADTRAWFGGTIETENETTVDSGAYSFDVDVYFTFESLATFVDPHYPAAEFYASNVDRAFTCWVGGLVVSAGDLLSANPDGSIPLDYNGSLVVANATVISANIFG